MNDDRAADALVLAEAALREVLPDGVTEAEALVMAEDSALTRFANSEIHQNVAERNVVVNLRVVIGKRVGVASTGRTDREGLRRLAGNAVAIARVVEELGDWGGLPGPTPTTPVVAGYSAATATASPESRAEAVRAVIAGGTPRRLRGVDAARVQFFTDETQLADGRRFGGREVRRDLDLPADRVTDLVHRGSGVE